MIVRSVRAWVWAQAGGYCRARIGIVQPALQGGVTLWQYHTELGQQITDAVADGQSFSLQPLTYPVPGQANLLIFTFDGHKAHLALPCGGGTSFVHYYDRSC